MSENTRPGSGPADIAFDCRFFRGDRPCSWHKQLGVLCTCDHYERVAEQLLLIKLDAMGDVLRTTALLRPLADAHPNAAIVWLTRSESVPLLARNPYVTEVLEYGPDALVQLQCRRFDRVINLDAGKTSAALASLAHGRRKDGYILDECGRVHPTNAAARHWLEMGIFDQFKRAGTRTYQSVMAEILGVSKHDAYVLELSPEERAAGHGRLAALGIDFGRPIVGLNTGAGGRWPLKQWREEGYVEVIASIARQYPAQFLLLGGPAERARNERLKRASAVPVYDAGCDNPVRDFAALVAHCDLVVTGDTLAMHIALALRRRTVVLFGPTSAPEIELYGLGEKVLPDMGCLSCYKTSCDFVPNCMDLITSEMVASAVARQLNALAPAVAAT